MKKGICVSIALLSLAVISSATIMCRSADGFEPAASTVELRHVQRINTALTGAINTAIRHQANGGVLAEWTSVPRTWTSAG